MAPPNLRPICAPLPYPRSPATGAQAGPDDDATLHGAIAGLARIFEAHPALAQASVSITLAATRASEDLAILIRSNLGYSGKGPHDLRGARSEHGAEATEGIGALVEWGRGLDASALEKLHCVVFERAEGAPLLPCLMAQGLAPEAFAQWERGQVDSGAAPGSARRPPRAL